MADTEQVNEEHYREAEDLLARNRYVEAIDRLQMIAPHDPVLYNRARIIMAEGFSAIDFGDIAGELLDSVDYDVFSDPDAGTVEERALVLYRAGEICVKHGLNDAAQERFRAIRRIAPSFRDVDDKLKELKKLAKQWDGAAERLLVDPDRYRDLKELARGGMGVVFYARDVQRDRDVAIKVIDFRYRRDIEARQRFMKEAGLAVKFVHPNIVRVLAVENHENPSIVMEYIQGESLRDMIDRRGRLTPRRIHKYLVQVIRALEYAHYNDVVHRDLKPGNIMAAPDDTVKVLDFGLAKILGRTTVTRQGTVIGTPFYMSPEQGKGEPVDARSDIYSLGVIVFEMAAGRRPFIGENIMNQHVNNEPPVLKTMAPGIPAWLDRMVARCLEKNPLDRYQSCSELLQELLDRIGEPPKGKITEQDYVPTEEVKTTI